MSEAAAPTAGIHQSSLPTLFRRRRHGRPAGVFDMTASSDIESVDGQAAIDTVCEEVLTSCDIDLRAYKRTTLERRVQQRVQLLGLPTLSAYVDRLRGQPAEVHDLLATIFINVTQFFRDPLMWAYLAECALPELLSAARDAETIRVWSAGCATGEETYTIAMLLADAMGLDDYQRRVRIYGTDIDEPALESARTGTFSIAEVSHVPETFRNLYFDFAGPRATFRRDLRNNIYFSRHDLVLDAPISRLDLLICRNTLMYFLADVQERILARLHFALKPHGRLILGKAEIPRPSSRLFTNVHLPSRVFGRSPPPSPPSPPPRTDLSLLRRLRRPVSPLRHRKSLIEVNAPR